MGKLGRNLRICGECGIAYTSVSFTKYIDQCPICNSRRFEAIPVKSIDEQFQHRFFSRTDLEIILSEDPEIAKIMQRKMDEMLKPKSEPKIEPGIIDLNDSNFDQIVSSDNLTLVDFWAEWCGPCKSMHPVFESLSKTYPNVKFARVNVDNNQNISMKFAVQSIPTFIMFKSGQIVDKMMGAVGAPGIHMICKKHSK